VQSGSEPFGLWGVTVWMSAAVRHAQAMVATGVAKFFIAAVCGGISSASFRGHLVYVANQTQLPIPVAAVTAAWRSVAPIQTTPTS
jgi:hypothetical protein